MKNTLLCASLLLCLLLVAGCGDRREEAQPVTAPVSEVESVPPALVAEVAVEETIEPVEVAEAEGVAGATEAEEAEEAVAMAEAEPVRYLLAYGAGNHGSIVGAASQSVEEGGEGSAVTAVADKGYHFVRWSDGNTDARRDDRNVTADLALEAIFAINHYHVRYVAGENGMLEGETEQLVAHGENSGPVQAVPDRGYHFVEWSDGVARPRRVDEQIFADLTVSARFAVNTYSIGGSVSGLVAGTRLKLKNNDEDELEITADGAFQFPRELVDDAPYAVVVLEQPQSPNQICTVTRGEGVVDAEDVTRIRIVCVPRTYRVGGTVSGLPDGDRIALRKNGGDLLNVTGNGPFVFENELDDGSSYDVEVQRQPRTPNWTCDLINPSGVLNGADIGDIEVDCHPMAVLDAVTGIRKIRLNWNAQDLTGATFDLCLAREEFTSADFEQCRRLAWGMARAGVSTPLVIDGLQNDVTYRLQLLARYDSGRLTYSEPIAAIPFGGLNDSGIDWCADDSVNPDSSGARTEKVAACEARAASHPGQDAMQGRDFEALSRTLTKTGSGAAGFDFTRICRSGQAAGEGRCPPNPIPGTGFDNWGCNRDNVTGLIWEVKTDSGAQNKNNTYSWYLPEESVNGGDPGVAHGGICEGSACDTRAYVELINRERLCGADDWRLPTRKELLSIVDNGRFNPAIDPRVFPHTPAEYYWTSSPYPDQSSFAWQVYFLYGEAYPIEKSQAKPVRLVHGQTITFGMNNP